MMRLFYFDPFRLRNDPYFIVIYTEELRPCVQAVRIGYVHVIKTAARHRCRPFRCRERLGNDVRIVEIFDRIGKRERSFSHHDTDVKFTFKTQLARFGLLENGKVAVVVPYQHILYLADTVFDCKPVRAVGAAVGSVKPVLDGRIFRVLLKLVRFQDPCVSSAAFFPPGGVRRSASVKGGGELCFLARTGIYLLFGADIEHRRDEGIRRFGYHGIAVIVRHHAAHRIHARDVL